MDSLVQNLNGFIREKGLTARNVGPLRRAVDAAERGMAAVPTGDQDMDSAAILYQRITQTVRENADRTRREAEQAAEETAARIEEEGARFSPAILPGTTPEEIERKEKESADCVHRETESLSKRLDSILLAGVGRTAQELESLEGELIFRNIRDRTGRNMDWRSSAKAVKTVADLTTKLSQGTRMTGGVARASGSAMHTGILRVGHFFGHSFRPWEAVKTARGIGNVAAVLSAAMVVVDVAMIIREQKRQDEAIAELNEVPGGGSEPVLGQGPGGERRRGGCSGRSPAGKPVGSDARSGRRDCAAERREGKPERAGSRAAGCPRQGDGAGSIDARSGTGCH